MASSEDSARRIHAETGAAWEILAKASYAGNVEEDVRKIREGTYRFIGPEMALLGDVRDWCRRAIHLQCSGGSDILALWKMGVEEVIGIDISETALSYARKKAELLGAPAKWYCCDVLDTPDELFVTADLVFTGCGALPWMMDIDAWARVVESLLRKDGRVLVFEGHPLDNLWSREADGVALRADGASYFDDEPRQNPGFPAQAVERHTNGDPQRPAIRERHWRPGRVINALAARGLRYMHFEEYPNLFWNQFPNLPRETADRLPHTYSIMMRKP